MSKFTLVLSLFCFFFAGPLLSKLDAQVVPLTQAHSHNDYNRNRPLYDALDHGFTSVEWDILLIKGTLYVGHNLPTEKNNHNLPKLKEAFLDILFRHFQENGKMIYPNYDGPFYVWIDIKNKKKRAYRKLKKLLKEYRPMLHHYQKGKLIPGKVVFIISGERPIDKIVKDKNRLVTVDGRKADLAFNYSWEAMPFISMNMWKICRTDTDSFPPEELEKLNAFTESVHQQGKKVRLWATPEQETIWRQLLDGGVDLLNTDQLERLKRFLVNE